MVILVDDEDRENEGDLVMAAELVTPEAINFMALHGRGLICLALTPERCDQLDLPLMVQRTRPASARPSPSASRRATGVTTGISAADRAHTIRVAVADARPSDLARPGHVFPLRARPGACWCAPARPRARRPRAPRRARARRRHLRDHERRRHHGASPAARKVRRGLDPARTPSTASDVLRDFGLGAQVLVDLGCHKVRLLTNSDRRIPALEGFGLDLVERVPIPARPGLRWRGAGAG
jgi:hypothetical protein